MFYTVYKITNLINDKIYIGVHKTSILEDNYMGSGLNIKKAIQKYGIENFIKEYLFIFDNEKDMYEMELFIVNNKFIVDNKNYNLKEGGNGGWSQINKNYPIEKRIKNGKKFGSKAGSWNNKEKRLKILENIPIEKRRSIGKKLGTENGGKNKLDKNEIERRLNIIKDINLLEYGWVKKVSEKLKLTHTQVKRFMKKYYNGEYYIRK